MNPLKTVGIQYAALPYRIEARQVRILLITSRETRRWVIPKGWPMAGLKPQDAAAVEASEEAGLIGSIDDTPLGSYRYLKRLKRDQTLAVQVIVFPLRVEGQVATWKEQGQRTYRWFAYRRAASLVAEPSLRRLIRDFGAARTASFLANSLRRYRSWRFGVRH
jgi:8-oxo-dGTP pyrophosphatase MutT (NUDIX family)